MSESERSHRPDLRLAAEARAQVGPLERARAAFHQINSLLPEDQDVVSVEPGCSIPEALAIMDEHGFSQLPVMAGTEVLGMITHRAIARAAAGVGRILTRSGIDDISVEDIVEEFHFARPSDEVETVLERLDRDGAILVGDPNRLMAVATPSDLIRFFYEIAHPFVLIQEIEICLRACIEGCTSPKEVSAAARCAKLGRLRDWEPEAIELRELTLTEQIDIVKNGDNYSRYFERMFGRSRHFTLQMLNPVATIRNELFHFKRPPTTSDLTTLSASRSWLLVKVRAASAGGTI